jgi:isopenicillin N synthase-like dioxygenase
MNIPVVDLSDFLSGDPSRKQQFVNALGKAYEEVGFVAVKNHGIPDDLIADLYKYVQQFFQLPTETKLKYEKKSWPASVAIPLSVANMRKVMKHLI